MPQLEQPVPTPSLLPGDRVLDLLLTVESMPSDPPEGGAVMVKLVGIDEPVPFAYDFDWRVDRPEAAATDLPPG